MENLVNPRCVKQKYSFSQRVFENWWYFTVSVIIQASSKHQLLKITVRISPGLPKILGTTRRAFDWQKNYSRPCSIMCWKMCAWFKFSYGVKNLLLNVYQYFILLAFFRFPQFIGEYGGKAPDFWHADKALCGYKIIWSHYWEIQRSSTNLRSRGYTNTATKKHFYRCSWTKRGKSTDYNVHENAVQDKCILGTSYNIFLNIGGRNKANEVYITWPCRETSEIFFNFMKQDDNTNLVTIVLASFTFTPWCDLSDCILWYTYTSGEGFVCHPMVSCPPPPPVKLLKNEKRKGKIKQETGVIIFL